MRRGNSMKELKGRGVFGDYAEGPLLFQKKRKAPPANSRGHDRAVEEERFCNAQKKAKDALSALYESARESVGEEEAQVFAIHRMMLEDPDFLAEVKEELSQGVTAEYAVYAASEGLASLLISSRDDYMRERALDVRDAAGRIISLLTGEENSALSLADAAEPVILCAEDLTPSETMGLDKKKIAAFVTAAGSANSHTAILARSLGIPALVGVGETLFGLTEGSRAFVIASEGRLLADPDEATLLMLRERKKEAEQARLSFESARGKPLFNKEGGRITVYANIGSADEAKRAIAADAEGIGLFRSEFLYIGRNAPPDEEEQFAAYRLALESAGGRRVVIRTLDIGADKQADYLAAPKEENPALGVRGIRLCLVRPELFAVQLRALLRAAPYGKLAILFPMIASRGEVVRAKEALAAAADSLAAEKIPYSDDVEIGVMIETPAAALISEELAEEVDFFSVGSNDLSQYTLAIDRQNAAADAFFDPHHEAVLKLITLAADNAHKKGIWIGICGELAADLALTDRFLSIPIDELSVAPGAILPLKHRILSLTGERAADGSPEKRPSNEKFSTGTGEKSFLSTDTVPKPLSADGSRAGVGHAEGEFAEALTKENAPHKGAEKGRDREKQKEPLA